MVILTWNANRVGRWPMLYDDPDFKQDWDFVCLQEAGDPLVDYWTQSERSRGIDSWKPKRSGRDTDESSVRRVYVDHHPAIGQIYITHCEWANRQKNHLVIVTRTKPITIADIGNDSAVRPVVALKATLRCSFAAGKAQRPGGLRVQFPAEKREVTVLLASVHLSPGVSLTELRSLRKPLASAAEVLKAAGWILVGDFNAHPDEVENELRAPRRYNDETYPDAKCWRPPWPTHSSGECYDYIALSRSDLLGISGPTWRPRTPASTSSDHTLQACRISALAASTELVGLI
jgi:Endonuclease/Exonuclease/phosphatase family